MSRVALVVGINTYHSDGLHNLNAPAEDAEAIAQLLEKYGDFNVIRLPEAIDPDTKKPFVGKETYLTYKALQRALVQLFNPKSNQVPDTALFYFSGHGLWETDGVQEGFLATSDADPDQGLNGLPLKWLRDLLQDSPINQQIVLLDCCHSGAILNVAEANPGKGNTRDRCFIAASRDFEDSYQAIGSKYSVLTQVLLEALESHRKYGGLTNVDLVSFVNEKMRGELQQMTFSIFGQPIEIIRRGETVRESKQELAENAKCPYKGLLYFENNQEDSDFFCGRDELTESLVEGLRNKNFLALLGASGSGKSSVLRAGLLHSLRQGLNISGSDRWDMRIMLPTEHPLKSLAQAFVDPQSNDLERVSQFTIAQNLFNNADGLINLAQMSQAPRILLVIDQFEEVFTLCQDLAEREKFFALLINALAKAKDKFSLAIAMRADFLGKCVEHNYSGLAKLIQQNLVTVTPMNEMELREAIAEPAKKIGAEVEEGLIRQIIEDVAAAPANLPLMQFALSELWKYRDGNRLTLNAYNRELGGIKGALEKRANDVYGEFSNELEQKAVKYIFVSLTQLGDGTEDTRRRVILQNLPTELFSLELIEKVVKQLADHKLVVTSALAGDDGKLQEIAIVDVAHEALIRNWSRLRLWLDENRDGLRKQRKLENRAEEWDQVGNSKSKADLLQGRSLRDAKDLIQSQKNNGNVTLSNLAIAFVKASEKKQQGDRLKLSGIFLFFPFIGSLVVLHFYLLSTAQKILATNECKQNLEIRPLLEYMFFTGQRALPLGVKLCKENLSAIKLQELNLKRADFRGALLDASDFQDSLLENADFSQANLKDANFKNSWLKNAKFEGAYLFNSKLRESNDLTEQQLTNSILCKTELPVNFQLNPDRDCQK